MSDLQTRFATAKEQSTQLKSAPDNQIKLKMYALYKQSTDGDVSGDKPGAFDFVGQYKYKAWEELKGTSKDEAAQQYIDLIEKLKGELGYNG